MSRVALSSYKIIVVSVVVAATAMLSWWWWNAPRIRLERGAHSIFVDVQTFGEYPTTITRIRISDILNNSTVLDLRAQQNIVQIRSFSLVHGRNSAQFSTAYGSWVTRYPINGDDFLLSSRTPYRVEIWGDNVLLNKSSFEFQFND